jgi:hypothetical protein
MYRAGSQIRVRISAPNGDQPIWSFNEADPAGQANVDIGYGPEMPSRLDLPVVPGVSAPTGLPPCPGLRGEPCRDYVPFQNRAGDLGSGDTGGGDTAGGDLQGGGGSQGAGSGSQDISPTPRPTVAGATGKKTRRCKKHKRHAGASASRKRCRHK